MIFSLRDINIGSFAEEKGQSLRLFGKSVESTLTFSKVRVFKVN